jgi:trimeric autotransporter adhesin
MKIFKSIALFLLTLSVLIFPVGEGQALAASLRSISFDASDWIYVGEYENVYIEAQYSDSSTRDISTDAQVSPSYDEGILSFTPRNFPSTLRMTGEKAGWVTVDVSYTEGSTTKTTYKNIKVKPSLGISSPGTIKVGETWDIKARVWYERNTPEYLGSAATYTSSNPAVISVSNTGVIKGVSPGIVTITATYKERFFGETLQVSTRYDVK